MEPHYLGAVVVMQAVFLLGYYLFLDRQAVPVIKRWYLLAGVLLPFAIPFVPVWYTQAGPLFDYYQAVELTTAVRASPLIAASVQPVNDHYFNFRLAHLIWTMYLIGLLYQTYLVGRSLMTLVRELRRGRRVSIDGLSLVLLPNAAPSHTFLRWVFVGTQTPSRAVLAHEFCHARQLHSIDRLLLSALRIAWWWNPLVYLYERAVCENHELLADRAVVRLGYSPSGYQRELLAALARTNSPTSLASGLNYQLTKKRFKMMTQTNHLSRGRLFVLTGLWIGMLLLFGHRLIAQADSVPSPPPPPPPPNAPVEVVAEPFDHTNPPQAPPYMQARLLLMLDDFEPNPPSADMYAQYSNSKEFGVWMDGKRVENSVLANYSVDDFAHVFVSVLYPNAKDYGKYRSQVDLTTKVAYEANRRNPRTPPALPPHYASLERIRATEPQAPTEAQMLEWTSSPTHFVWFNHRPFKAELAKSFLSSQVYHYQVTPVVEAGTTQYFVEWWTEGQFLRDFRGEDPGVPGIPPPLGKRSSN